MEYGNRAAVDGGFPLTGTTSATTIFFAVRFGPLPITARVSWGAGPSGEVPEGQAFVEHQLRTSGSVKTSGENSTG